VPIPTIHVYEGGDPAILQSPSSVSGFERWTKQRVNGLCTTVREEMETTCRQAPETLTSALGPHIDMPLYATMNPHEDATLRFDYPLLRVSIDAATGKRTPLGFLKGRCRGMQVSADTDHTDLKLRRAVGHETMHLLSSHALHSYWRGPWEATVARLEKEYYGPRHGVVAKRPWIPRRIFATTGFRPADFGDVDMHDTAQAALMFSSYFALDNLRKEHIWSFWRILTQRQLTTGYMPGWQDIEQAMLVAADVGSGAALREPVFQSLTAGTQHLLAETADGGARTYSFETHARDDFGQFEGDSMHQVQFETRDTIATDWQVRFLDVQGRELPDATLWIKSRAIQDFDYEKIAEANLRTTTNPHTAGALGRAVAAEVAIPGFRSFLLHKRKTP
jgi:hypothetical protein